jgi:hypothetical protein
MADILLIGGTIQGSDYPARDHPNEPINPMPNRLKRV